ncbi:hypothetical protein DVA76_18660, partial [Acinetobacter baumannii]
QGLKLKLVLTKTDAHTHTLINFLFTAAGEVTPSTRKTLIYRAVTSSNMFKNHQGKTDELYMTAGPPGVRGPTGQSRSAEPLDTRQVN